MSQKIWHISINDICISKYKYLYFAINDVATMMFHYFFLCQNDLHSFHSNNQKQKYKNFKQVFTNERQTEASLFMPAKLRADIISAIKQSKKALRYFHWIIS